MAVRIGLICVCVCVLSGFGGVFCLVFFLTVPSMLVLLVLFVDSLEQSYRNFLQTGKIRSNKGDPNADYFKWKGVQCNNQTGYVQKLDLHGSFDYQLSDEINPSITELQHLKYLDLSHLSTGSQISKYIGSFSNLRYLDLSYGVYYGKIPSQIWNLSQL
ncbi:unnamed protein product [Trifolium pratense]|uniref:Uncharacterized protein n=1 Tax=Trifolium pratense TaxID=57577 RepID=A0ACB0JAS1_TRIPR|nr:unnamed protein product [Trifolium pratense]